MRTTRICRIKGGAMSAADIKLLQLASQIHIHFDISLTPLSPSCPLSLLAVKYVYTHIHKSVVFHTTSMSCEISPALPRTARRSQELRHTPREDAQILSERETEWNNQTQRLYSNSHQAPAQGTRRHRGRTSQRSSNRHRGPR
jgi:hypothetical protein